jgi:O-antigen/teichoic acid export membrane protein
VLNIKKRDVIISYIGYGFKVISTLIVLPVILGNVSSNEYGLWLIFLSIGTLATLIDFGLGNVLTRYTTYAYSGATHIPTQGLPSKNEDGTPNYELLFKIFVTSKKLYRKIALIVFGFLAFMLGYIIWVSANEIEVTKVIVAWSLYSFGISLGFYFNYYNAFIKGLGKIKEIQVVGIVNTIIYILLQIFFITIGLDLIGLGIANLLSVMLLRFQLSKHVNKVINSKKEIYKIAEQLIEAKSDTQINLALKKNSNQVGLVTISNYIQGQGGLLLISAFVPLSITAKYGLSMQLISIVISISIIPFNTFLPQLSSFQIQRKFSKLKKRYINVTMMIFLTYLVGSLVITLFGDRALALIKSNTDLLNNELLILLITYHFILTNHQRATSFISLGNNQPFVKPYIISSALSLLICLSGFMFNMNILGFILVNLIIQLSYNGWKWPLMAWNKINVKGSIEE